MRYLFFALILFTISCNNQPTPEPEVKTYPKQTLYADTIEVNKKGTINSFVYEQGRMVGDAGTITLWNDPIEKDKGKAGLCEHGDNVKVIRINKYFSTGQSFAFIEKKSGEKGWVLTSFIKEYK